MKVVYRSITYIFFHFCHEFCPPTRGSVTLIPSEEHGLGLDFTVDLTVFQRCGLEAMNYMLVSLINGVFLKGHHTCGGSLRLAALERD